MKTLSIFLILATIVLLSSAFSVDKEKDDTSGLLQQKASKGDETSLQNKKGPGKIPGPKLNSDEKQLHFSTYDEDEKKSLQNGPPFGLPSPLQHQRTRGHFLNGGRDITNLRQDSQEDRSNLM